MSRRLHPTRRHAPPTSRAAIALAAATLLSLSTPAPRTASARGLYLPGAATQSSDTLTPLQRQIDTQSRRLSSADVEERRDAVASLGALRRPEASRAAGAALGDRSAVVRAHATRAVLSLAPAEVAALLAPVLLRDRDEFMRRESAYALGLARAGAAVPALLNALERDKQASVRGAAAVALGQIGDPAAVPLLARKLSERIPGTGLLSRVTRGKRDEDEFVRRSAAAALGLIGDRAAAPALIDALSKERSEDDVRREAALALGLLGDPAAIPALRAALNARDPHLSRIAFEALRKLEASAASQP